MMNVACASQLNANATMSYPKLKVHNIAKHCQSCSEVIHADQDYKTVPSRYNVTEFFHSDYTGCQKSMQRHEFMRVGRLKGSIA